MHKAQRLIQLMMIVNEKKQFTIRELTQELGVSRRTVIRDLMELSELGVPLYSEVGAAGGYRLLREKLLPPVSFRENEAAALFFAGQSLTQYDSLPFRDEVDSALQKLYHYLPSDIQDRISRLKERLVFWVPKRGLEAPHLQLLLEAAITHQAVTMEYDAPASTTTRTILPIGLYSMNGLWYCQAYCFHRDDYRVYRADRVRSAALCPEPPKQVRVEGQRIQDWIMRTEEGELTELVARFTPEGAGRAKSDPWLAPHLQQVEGGGLVRMRMSVSMVEWAAGLFLGYGREVRVEKPEALIRGIRRELAALTAMYGEEEDEADKR